MEILPVNPRTYKGVWMPLSPPPPPRGLTIYLQFRRFLVKSKMAAILATILDDVTGPQQCNNP